MLIGVIIAIVPRVCDRREPLHLWILPGDPTGLSLAADNYRGYKRKVLLYMMMYGVA